MNMSINLVKRELEKHNIKYITVLDDGCDFYTICYTGNTVQESNVFFKGVKQIPSLSVCNNENGVLESGAHWQRFKYWM